MKGFDTNEETGMPRIVLSPISLGVALRNVVGSISLEVAALSHVIHAEGEKLQRVIGLKGVSTDQLAAINRNVSELTGEIAGIGESLSRKLDAAFLVVRPDPENELEMGTRDSSTGLPIRGANWILRSLLRPDETFEAQTDSIGAFTFTNVPAGLYSLTLAAAVPGYITPSLFTVEVEADGTSWIWQGGPDDEEAERVPANGAIIYLDPIAFTLTTYNCETEPPTPLEGITWVLTNLKDEALTYEATTNSAGEFSFTYLPVGVYSLTLKEDTVGIQPLQEAYTILYVSNEDITLCRLPRETSEEECVDAHNEEICLEPVAFTIKTVDCLTKDPIEGATWVLTNLATEEKFVSTTDVNGEFSFEFVPAGEYSLTLADEEYTVEVNADGTVMLCYIDEEEGLTCEPTDGAVICLC